MGWKQKSQARKLGQILVLRRRMMEEETAKLPVGEAILKANEFAEFHIRLRRMIKNGTLHYIL